MDRGLYVSMTGAKQIMQAQAVNNHNIANASTTGFRADAVAFTSQPIYGAGFPTRVNAVAGNAGIDFSSGVLTTTSQRTAGAVRDGSVEHSALHPGDHRQRRDDLGGSAGVASGCAVASRSHQ